MPMRLLVTGAEGMLGRTLCPVLCARGHDVIQTDRHPTNPATRGVDLCDADAVSELVSSVQPACVLHLAAETDVDRCELDPSHAYATNAAATEHLVKACQRTGARVLYMSSAAVFDGHKPTPYVEIDSPNPINVYGCSKLAGEYAVRRHTETFCIVRAGWMVGGYEHDKKFIGKLLRLLESRRELSVVMDKRGSLSFATDLSRVLAQLVEGSHTGIFHVANQGVCSRYDIARKLVYYLGRADVSIRPVGSDAFPLPAPRSDSEALQNLHLQTLGLDTMPSWEKALQQYVEEYITTLKPCIP